MEKRWIALYVENQPGVLAKISSLFAGKAYNMGSLTVGTTEDETVSRMTISVHADDITFEQIKKQLNRMVEVIKVIDLSDQKIHMKELLYVKVKNLDANAKNEVFHVADTFSAGGYCQIVDYGEDSVIMAALLTDHRNDELIALLKKEFKHIEVVRGGSVAIESISTSCR